MKIKLLSTLIICLLPPIIASAYDGRHGWFIQKAPQQLILCNGEGVIIRLMWTSSKRRLF